MSLPKVVATLIVLAACALGETCRGQCSLVDWLGNHDERVAANQSYLDTDGPSFTRANSVVPRSMALLETRYFYSSNPSTNSFPQFDLRYGLLERLELRAEWSGVDTGPALLRTNHDLEVGFKYLATKQDGIIPLSAIMLELFTPTDNGPNYIPNVAPEIDYMYGWALNKQWSFECSTGAIFGQPGAPGVTQFYQSGTINRTWLGGRYMTFGEVYSLFGSGTNPGAVQPNIDCGAQWRLGYNLQLDWRVGMGLNDQTAPFFTNGGVSFRY
jgi:hypothetical protein